jgi:uncharacterized protein (TIGR02466 family)
MIEVTEQRIFFQSIFTSHLDVPQDITSKVYSIQQESSRQISNVSGWQSETYNYGQLDWIDPSIDSIAEIISELCKTYGLDYIPNECGYWFNVNKRGSYNIQHTHPHSIFSAVWYLTAPEDCGDLSFHRHDREVNEWFVPATVTPFNYDSFVVKPEVGKLVVFPSYMLHSVTQSNSDENRISVAFNFASRK